MPPQQPSAEIENFLTYSSLWIFGYGSLIWRPNFEFSQKKVGYVDGFVRRFWQGCVSHRGVTGAPGRVATLVEEEEGRTWGVAFQVRGEEQVIGALKYLNIREGVQGDYRLVTLKFYAQDGFELSVLAYIATPWNQNYLGPAPSDVIAQDIVRSSGHAGTNTEYLFRLVEFMQEVLPDVIDEHLKELNQKTKHFLECLECKRNIHYHVPQYTSQTVL
ncbi:Glutathione-specific gamma-glutamylcyclotransferase 1 [Holothuria leucospilota]|uniref:glutathione-specific gamma-glutamylcyclotransferase n=1 Tax=Holothuria leucospilota TaxID=206669 RepID=A0A9Q1HDR8_HOLLE|nr:Glutathione-specific gamma-glutamylcyclotransferase 1 [Holothuria leucospilota]